MTANQQNEKLNKRKFWLYVNKKIKRSVHHLHVWAIMNILYDEISKDLISGKTIKIFNFCHIYLKKTSPKIIHNFYIRKKVMAPGYKKVNVDLRPRLKKFLVSKLDADKLDNQ